MKLNDAGRSLGLLLARLGIAAIFLSAGYKHILDVGGMAATLEHAGYPLPKLMALVACLALLGGGLSVAAGAIMPLGTVALMLFLVPATYSFHYLPFRHGVAMQDIHLLKNVAILGGLLALFFAGPGKASFDYLLLGRRK